MRCSSSSTVGFFRFEALCGGGAALGTVSSARAAEPASKTLNANVAQKYSLVFRGACTLFIVIRSSHGSRESTAELGYRLSERAGTNIPSSAYTGNACRDIVRATRRRWPVAAGGWWEHTSRLTSVTLASLASRANRQLGARIGMEFLHDPAD